MTVRMIGHYPGWRVAVAGAAAMDLTDMYALSDLNVMHRHTITGSSWTEGRAERHSFGVRHRLRVPRLSYYLNYHIPLGSTSGTALQPDARNFDMSLFKELGWSRLHDGCAANSTPRPSISSTICRFRGGCDRRR